MTTLSDDTLLQLLGAGESDRVEFKESLEGSSPGAVREAICAFANDLPGHGRPGVVFVGARDDGSVVDLPVTDELLRQLADMKTDGNIVPPPSMTVRRLHTADGVVAVMIVQPSDSPPVRLRGRVHIRIGPRRAVATAQDERILSGRRRYGDTPFDVRPISRATLADLDLTRFQNEYLPQAFAQDILEANDRTLVEQLAATKMISAPDDPTPTVLGMLSLGRVTQDHLPGAYVQFLRFVGNELTDDISDEEAIGGTISDMLRRFDEKLHAHNRTEVDYMSGPVDIRRSTYPIVALQQITRNAVIHRSYEGNNAPVRVHWYDDRIDVFSPGGVFGSVTADNFGSPGITAYRNPNLAEAMRNLGFVQRYGIGIPLARRLLGENGNPEMEFLADMSNVLVTIRSA